MAEPILYFHSLGSPWTYLGGQRFTEMARKHGNPVVVKPVDYGKIFPGSGGLPVHKRPPQRQSYRLLELERWRDFLGVPLTIHPKFFPADQSLGARMVHALNRKGDAAAALDLSNAILRAIWAEEKNIADPDTLVAIAGALGHDGAALLADAEKPEPLADYEAATQEAIDLEVFGAPTYVYKGIRYWGQDRLDFVERALAG